MAVMPHRHLHLRETEGLAIFLKLTFHQPVAKLADLRIFHCGIFPEEGSACDDWTLCIWNCDGNFNGTDL